MEIKIHSVTDLITNSSTTIFTYSDNSIEPLKGLIDEILELNGCGKKCDDIFEAYILPDKNYCEEYFENTMDNGEEEEIEKLPIEVISILKSKVKVQNKWKAIGEYVDKVYEDIISGKTGIPQWVNDYKEWTGIGECEVCPPTLMYLRAKEDKYKGLGEKVIKFLYSTSSEEG